MYEFYREAGPQLALGALGLELLLGSLILRWGVSWRNRLSAQAVRVPDLATALGLVGLSLILTAPATLGLMGVMYALASAAVKSPREVGEAVWLLFWVFLPFTFAAFFLFRALLVSWLLRIDFDDALVVQLCETLMYVIAGILLGAAVVAMLFFVG